MSGALDEITPERTALRPDCEDHSSLRSNRYDHPKSRLSLV
jgi:hypothetical protein